MDKTPSALSWQDIPEQPWPEATIPSADALADWLTGMTREQLLFVLERKQADWSKDSDCFVRDHEGTIRHLESRLLNVQSVLQMHGIDVSLTHGNDPSEVSRG